MKTVIVKALRYGVAASAVFGAGYSTHYFITRHEIALRVACVEQQRPAAPAAMECDAACQEMRKLSGTGHFPSLTPAPRR